MLVTEQVSQGGGPTSPVGIQHTPTIIKSSPHLQNTSITYRKTRTRTGRMDIKIPKTNVPSSVADEAITKEIHDGLGRATTTVSSLEAEQGGGNISKTQTKATPSGPSSLRTSSEGGPGCHFTKWNSPFQARPERLSNLPNEPTVGEVINTLKEEEASLDHEDSPKQGRIIKEIDKDENANLVKSSKQGEAHETGKHIIDFSTASPQTDNDETLTETLLNIKRSAAKDKGKARLAQENLAQAEQWDDVQAQIQANEDLAQRMLEEERESLSIEERFRLLSEFIDNRKKMLGAKRAEEKRNKAPTQA
nr:hypothetical protein [Tanacetum cinerariifolium]